MRIPTVECSPAERGARGLNPETLDRAEQLFNEWGVVQLVDVFDQGFVERLSEHFHARHRVHLAAAKEDLRPLFSPRVAGPFAKKEYHSNPLVFPLAQRVLGEDCILGTFGSIVSLPGAPEQPAARGHESLYDDFSIDVRLPSYALTVVIPLADIDHESGAIRVWPGSHREPSTDKALKMESESPSLSVGSALITDSRLLQRGSPNRSPRVRPVLYNTYHRSWYRNTQGYASRPAVDVGIIDQLRMEPDLHSLFRVPREASSVDRVQWLAKRMVHGTRVVREVMKIKRALSKQKPPSASEASEASDATETTASSNRYEAPRTKKAAS